MAPEQQKLLKIKEVVEILQVEQPGLSIPTVRFWEDQGLIRPARTKSGYRLFTQADIERLRYIIIAQRDRYLPLKVIKEHLDMMDQGIEPPQPETFDPVSSPDVQDQEPTRELVHERIPSKQPMKLTRQELLLRSGLPESAMVELERLKVIQPRRGSSYYGWEAFTLAVVARKMTPLGLDLRQLRGIKQAAEHEVSMIEYTVSTYRRPEMAQKATFDLAELILHAHAALIQSALDHSDQR